MFIEMLDGEPKKLCPCTIKFDSEEVEAINEFRMLDDPPKTFSAKVRELCQTKMATTYVFRLGFHNVRTLSKNFESKLGHTFEVEVIPESCHPRH